MSKDAQIIDAILKEMSVTEYEPKIVHQLMEFTNCYVTSILQEAQVFSSYAKKDSIDVGDVQLAIQMQTDKTVTSPPPKELLLELAREKNNQPLPPVKTHNGLRIPFDKYTLIGTNYKLKEDETDDRETQPQPQPQHEQEPRREQQQQQPPQHQQPQQQQPQPPQLQEDE